MVALAYVSLVSAQKVQEKDVPATIKAAFQKNYPTARELKWEKENGNYEAEFEMEEADYSVLIDISGNIIETEAEIRIEALPADAVAYVSKNYAGQKIREAARIIDSKGAITYEVEIKNKDLIFDGNGDFIKEIKH